MEAWDTYRELIYCLNFTGLRVGDALSLRWENVNLRFSTIRLTQIKPGKEVIIRIPSVYRERLEKLAALKGVNPSGYVHTNSSGHKITYPRMYVAIRSVLKSCGIVKKSPLHSFRHIVGMRMLGAGIPVHVTANQLGDTVETVVRNYIKPELPSLADIDRVNWAGVSGNCQYATKETEGFGGF